MSNYTSKAKVVSIKATSRASISVPTSNSNNQYFTVEYTEERSIPDVPEIDLDKERALLWERVNEECDNQIEEIYKSISK